ncbi:4-hydroxyphenylpyruvate dioxygenase [Tetrabaena socialis]|uniref:4-hydroxyphenylpyruvate dioxygenase n=1 Tax=Tetrabaena socialis TaxID=47790 RepID=A0A2J8A4J9_9CHLO|nr:4-hydroxyphenylpyruvate dioxygenase [Tetrabaena socialis]|eukprot:PNH07462.1 4-hydroxyphenylpyruvate dioxygenase [Tetrabaena socialis]
MGAGGAATPGGREGGMRLVGYNNFVRQNPLSDKFAVHKFHHIEFWCGDATNTYKRFQHGLGMPLVAKSDQSTGNQLYASYVLRSNDLVFAFSAPYSRRCASLSENTPMQQYDINQAYEFINCHGMAVRAVGLLVDDAKVAYEVSVANGGRGVLPPAEITDPTTGATQTVSEVSLYGDVVLRELHPRFHEFAEFVAEDVGTVDSGLNSMVLASNNEAVLLPVNEPTFGTPRKSQIQTYLEQNEGPGLQHLALATGDIFETLRAMRARSEAGGFEFMPSPSDKYYRDLPKKIGDVLTAEQFKDVEALGILADKDDQGVLLQIFTKPLGDRPTVFIEIIQRVGCMREVVEPATGTVLGTEQAAGCGGFGKGNFSELFKSIEDYERTLNV